MTGQQVFEYLSKLTPEERQLPFFMEYVNERDEPHGTRRIEVEGIGVNRFGNREAIIVE